jgi:hypothetical protein
MTATETAAAVFRRARQVQECRANTTLHSLRTLFSPFVAAGGARLPPFTRHTFDGAAAVGVVGCRFFCFRRVSSLRRAADAPVARSASPGGRRASRAERLTE